MGLNIADLGVFVRARNRLGYYDAPTQAKVFWWGKRYLISPYVYGPGANERSGIHESGGGMLAEFDITGNHRIVAGVNFLDGHAALEDRRMVGPYARLGFGKWGFLAEHDITDRTLKTGSLAREFPTDGQLRPTLLGNARMAGGIGDRGTPARREAVRRTPECRQVRTGRAHLEPGDHQHRTEAPMGPISGRLTKSVLFTLAVKTVHWK